MDFTCPYQYQYCGSATSDIEMHPVDRKSIKIEIENRYFVDAEMCYYQIHVNHTVLDTWANNYTWNIEF